MRPTLLAALLVAAVACGTSPPRVTSAPLASDVPITVVPFAPAGSVVSYDTSTATLGSDFAADVVEELRRRGRTAQFASEPVADTTTVAGRLIRVDGGSHAARFWLGFGAGRASVSAEGSVTRPDGTVLATFRERRSASGEAELGFAGDQYLVGKCLRALAGDVAEMVVTGSYREAVLDE